MTFYEELTKLRHEYDRLCIQKKNPTYLVVANAYFRTYTTNRTNKMIFSVA